MAELHLAHEVFNLIYPVGSVYINTKNVNPELIFGGTWKQLEGRFLIGVGTATDVNNDTRTLSEGQNGGEYAHKLNVSEMPSHSHAIQDSRFYTLGIEDPHYTTGIAAGVAKGDGPGWKWVYGVHPQGDDTPHNNVPPYIAVYMWERTA